VILAHIPALLHFVLLTASAPPAPGGAFAVHDPMWPNPAYFYESFGDVIMYNVTTTTDAAAAAQGGGVGAGLSLRGALPALATTGRRSVLASPRRGFFVVG
jgi:hypothetical protein